MKVIGLLNKIANGKRPEKIKYKNKIYNWSITTGNYILEDDRNVSINWDFVSMFELRNEVEIIEEDKKIEKMSVFYEEQINENCSMSEPFNKHELKIIDKINEIIDKINSMEDK